MPYFRYEQILKVAKQTRVNDFHQIDGFTHTFGFKTAQPIRWSVIWFLFFQGFGSNSLIDKRKPAIRRFNPKRYILALAFFLKFRSSPSLNLGLHGYCGSAVRSWFAVGAKSNCPRLGGQNWEANNLQVKTKHVFVLWRVVLKVIGYVCAKQKYVFKYITFIVHKFICLFIFLFIYLFI